MSRQDYLVRKFGGEDRARRLHASIAEIGRAEGIDFRFDRIRRVAASLDAHRLVRCAGRFGAGRPMVEALFDGLFHRGRDIGDTDVLVAIASAIGLDGAPPAASSPARPRSRRSTPTTSAPIASASTACPASSSPAASAIAGAQEPEVIERLLDVALVES